MSAERQSIGIFGATGSVGQSVKDVILASRDRFDVQVVTANRNARELARTAVELGARKAVLNDPGGCKILKDALAGTGIASAAGAEALMEAAGAKTDITVAAIVGMAGLPPLLESVRRGGKIAIANKEPLVAAGPLVMEEARRSGAAILPLDSEHNAVFQLFDPARRASVEKIILTASGGPFRTWTKEQMADATPEQAVAHPNWSMGPKISVDSATMMNKALEVIEAHYLFGLPPEKIEILVHPESVMHGMVEYKDGSVLAQMGASDMRTPVSAVLNWPQRLKTPGRLMDWRKTGSLHFEEPDFERFPALRKGHECLERGPWACLALNAANEVAVEFFLTNRIAFLDILKCIDHILERVEGQTLTGLAEILEFDQNVRALAKNYIINKTTPKTVSVS